MDPASPPETFRQEHLEGLRRLWAETVVLSGAGPWEYRGYGRVAPLSCWFGEHVPGIDSCEGQIEGAHWLRRRRVEKTIAQQLELPELVTSPTWQRRWTVFPAEYVDAGLDLVFLAAWDPRNGVPACEKHHRRFDGHRVDATNELVIWRHEVPKHVEAFALDWGLETALENRNPPIGGGI